MLNDAKKRELETKRLNKLFEKFVPFYDIPDNADFVDITEKVLDSSLIKKFQKNLIIDSHRRIILFTYPSDGLKIKGLISYVPEQQNSPTLIFLRGGNRNFGILNPADSFFSMGNYTVLSTTYRGGVSEGNDEFGGDDVNDVKNLIDFIPNLEKKLGIHIKKTKMHMVSASRGGMQMFLTLCRFPELQKRFSKIVSLSGILDMQDVITTRQDMLDMFVEDFGFKPGKNAKAWIKHRNPLEWTRKLKEKMDILIIQGDKDNRVSLEQGHRMVEKLKSTKTRVTYWEIEGGEHCLRNKKNSPKLVLKWFEQD